VPDAVDYDIRMRAPDAIGSTGGIPVPPDRRRPRPDRVGVAAEDGRIRLTRLFTADLRVAAPR
jgi:hypothetical protein